MRLPPRPDLDWKDDGTPVDRRVDDVFYTVDDGLAEARAVFLSGCGLPERWRTKPAFTVAELGFGTGLNFLAAWQLWQTTRPPDGWLNFVSFEGFPLEVEDIARAMRPWTELTQLAEALCAAWPPRAKGVRQITWPSERLTLILHVGAIEETLPQSVFTADAWFLDGFSPAKNPAMWADSLYPLIAARSRPGTCAATFTVAGAVRRGLTQAGFSVTKAPGHGRKRERLEAVFNGAKTIPVVNQTPHVAIIGVGIAGACLARQLTDRGAKVTIFDTADGPAQGASGNPLALVMPRLDASDSVQARLFVDAYLAAQAFYKDRDGVAISETVHQPRDPQEADRFAKVLADPPLGLAQLEALQGGGLLHKGSLSVQPSVLIPALLAGTELCWQTPATVELSERTVNGSAFDAIVLASGWQQPPEIADALDLTPRLGQIEWTEAEPGSPASAIARGDYAIAAHGLRLWGATYEDPDQAGPQTSRAARSKNMQALEALNPYWRQAAIRGPAHSRAGIRATTADRLPLIGGYPDVEAAIADRSALARAGWEVAASDYHRPGIFVATGYGSRGFTWAPWAAMILTAQIFADPLPAPTASLRTIAPIRQVIRRLKRGQI
ncbi:MAG: tRNA (5-methylaminomethyl-2-thiouridine)(34)-methyltransferase MnmD [Pseudomonadota bacterium]